MGPSTLLRQGLARILRGTDFRIAQSVALLVKSASRESFVRSHELAALGETLVPRELLAHVHPEGKRQLRASNRIHEFAKEVEPIARNGAPQLSGRERSILHCLVQGASNKVIARRIGIAESTVKVHVKTILRKIHACNRTQAAIWAMKNNVTVAPAIGPLAHALPLLPSGSVVMDVTPAPNGEDTRDRLHRDELHPPSMTNGAADPVEP